MLKAPWSSSSLADSGGPKQQEGLSSSAPAWQLPSEAEPSDPERALNGLANLGLEDGVGEAFEEEWEREGAGYGGAAFGGHGFGEDAHGGPQGGGDYGGGSYGEDPFEAWSGGLEAGEGEGEGEGAPWQEGEDPGGCYWGANGAQLEGAGYAEEEWVRGESAEGSGRPEEGSGTEGGSSPEEGSATPTSLCSQFFAAGWCARGDTCRLVHGEMCQVGIGIGVSLYVANCPRRSAHF